MAVGNVNAPDWLHPSAIQGHLTVLEGLENWDRQLRFLQKKQDQKVVLRGFLKKNAVFGQVFLIRILIV